MILKNALYMLLVLHTQIIFAVEVVFMIDESASVGEKNFRNLKVLVQQTAEQIDERMGDNATYSILEFGRRIYPRKCWKNKAKFYEQLRTLKASNSGATKISNAFRATADRLFDHNKTTPRVMVIITDGVPRPGPKYGGPEMVRQAHRCFNESGVDKLVYVHLNGTFGSRPANPNVFNKVGPPYNQSTDMMDVPFKRPSTPLEVEELRIKIIGEDPTPFPTTAPTGSPTGSPTDAPTDAPAGSPTDDFSSSEITIIIVASIFLSSLVGLLAYKILTRTKFEKISYV